MIPHLRESIWFGHNVGMTCDHLNRPLALLWLLTTLCMATTGCVKFKHAMAVMPDGSGKVEITFGMGEAMLAHQGDDGLNLIDLDELIAQEDRGFVAFTPPEVWAENGFTYQRIVGYFDDVDQIVIEGDENVDAAEPARTTFVYDADAGRLTISRCLLQQVALETESMVDADPSERAVLGSMVNGLVIEESITVPGDIENAGPFEVGGRTAAAVIDEASILDEEEVVLDLWRNVAEVVIEFEPEDWLEAEQNDWAQELEAAKEAWAAVKASGSLTP